MTKQIAFIAVAFLLIASCSRKTYPKVSEVENVEVVIASNQGCNFGSLINIDFIAHTARRGSVNVNSFITFQDSSIYFYKNGLHLNVNPNGYTDSFIRVKYNYLDAIDWDSFKIELTYNEDICINVSGESAEIEEDKKTLVGKLLRIAVSGVGRDGKNGGNGKNAHSIKVYIWKDSVSDVYSIYVKNEQAKTFKYYVTNELVNLFIDASGGNGSNGQNGTTGAAGESGGNMKRGTNGKSGGDGGDAGNGGNGGDVVVYIHPNAQEFKDKVQIINYGGIAGLAGKGARGGSGGTGRPPGLDGFDGKFGYKGFDGYINVVKIEEFDIDDIL